MVSSQRSREELGVKKVAVFGLGFVGLPLALSFAIRGCEVFGVDVNTELVAELNEGLTHHLEHYHNTPIQQVLKEQLAAGRFRVTANPAEAMADCNYIIMTVGIPVVKGEHIYDHVESCAKAIGQGLKPNDLILVRSTLVPGMTQNYIRPILEKESGLKADDDFYLGYSSERIAEGRAFEEFENMPTLVSGVDRASKDRAMELLGIVTKADLVPCSSMEVVETAKVMENISRDVDIAMVNEFARFCKALGIDIFEVIKVANTHKRVKLLLPGPGVGGYCIPNALHYLTPKADEMAVPLPLLRLARDINEHVPQFVVSMVSKNLPVLAKQAKIAVFGLAMKDFSNDDRLSPALQVIELLEKAGMQVAAYDPAVPTKHAFKVDTIQQALQGAHGIVVLAKQNGIDYNNFSLFKKLMSTAGQPFILDTRNVYDRNDVESGGFILETL
ncbi:MAG: nucleotide sugar dehydrogenase [Carboxydocellales bacterium]